MIQPDNDRQKENIAQNAMLAALTAGAQSAEKEKSPAETRSKFSTDAVEFKPKEKYEIPQVMLFKKFA